MTDIPDIPGVREILTADRIEVHPHYIKLYLLCGILGVVAALCFRGALGAAPEEAQEMLTVIGVALVAAAYGVWRRARSGVPILVITADGIEDYRHGFIPWAQIKRWKHSTSLLNPGFGWTLQDGVEPPRNALIFRLTAAFNWFGGLGQRTYRRKMVLGGVEPLAVAFRRFHPSAEAK